MVHINIFGEKYFINFLLTYIKLSTLQRNYLNYLIINFINFSFFFLETKLQNFSKFTNTFIILKPFIRKR